MYFKKDISEYFLFSRFLIPETLISYETPIPQTLFFTESLF